MAVEAQMENKVETGAEQDQEAEGAGDKAEGGEKKPVKPDHPIFKKIEDGDLEAVQNLIEVG